MESITIDGQGEEDFRRSIEAMLRHGQADTAATRLRALMKPYAGSILPARFLTASSLDVALTGWDELAHRIGEHDRPGHRISALSVTAVASDFESGRFSPCIETRYFSDEGFPFSGAERADLLDGYSAHGSAWQHGAEGSDTALAINGIDDLYTAIAQLEARLMDSGEPSEHDIRAGSLGACFLAVLFHQAVRDTIDRSGLPRSLCVMAGTGEIYPYFDAPVMSGPECRATGAAASGPIALPPALAEVLEFEEDEEDEEDEKEGEESGRAQSYGSLLSLGGSIRAKKPVITVDEAEAVAASHHYELGAQHRLTIAGNSERIGVLPGLATPDEREAAYAPSENGPAEAWAEPEIPADDFANAGHWPEPKAGESLDAPFTHEPSRFAAEPACLDAPAEPALPEAVDEIVGKPPEHVEVPAAIEKFESAETARNIAPPPPPSRNPIPAPAAHSLRSRVVQAQTRRVTLTERLVVFVQSAGRWLSRLRR